MIGSVRGTVLERHPSGEVIVEVGGVGYRVLVPAGVLADLAVGNEAFLVTHLHVREDVLALYGFTDRDGRDTFEALLGASGVGPKLALAIVSVHPPVALRRLVAEGDVDALCLVPGVGKRTAQKLMLELKARLEVPDLDLVDAHAASADGSNADAGAAASAIAARAEVRAALVELGYGTDEVRAALGELPASGSVPDLLRAALRTLGARVRSTVA